MLSEHSDHLVEFVPVGLTGDEQAAAAALGLPLGRGMLGHLMTSPRPLRVGSVSEHAMAMGLPPGHPPVHSLLGVAINSRGQTYGNLYLSNRRDGKPFDEHDEAMIVVLADAAALAIDDARLLHQVREAEEFQRQLRPQLPDLEPIKAAGLSRPAAVAGPAVIGGDWYDAIRLPDGTCAVAMGDTGGHGLRAAAAMTQTRSMLRTLLYEHHRSPSVLLTQLDHRLQTTPDIPVTTACLARLRPAATGWRLRRSIAGHAAPLLLLPGEPPRYLDAEPGLPLGIDPRRHPR